MPSTEHCSMYVCIDIQVSPPGKDDNVAYRSDDFHLGDEV